MPLPPPPPPPPGGGGGVVSRLSVGWGCVLLSAEPALGIEFLRLVTQVEMRGVASGRIAGNRSDRLAGFDVLSRLYRHTGQVAIDRNVRSVTNEHVLESSHRENGGDMTLERLSFLQCTPSFSNVFGIRPEFRQRRSLGSGVV